MKISNIRKLRRELKQMRSNFAPVSSTTLESYATAVERSKQNRGKEPTWTRLRDPSLSPPLSIPNHSQDVKAGTARSIIDQLLSDLDEWEQFLDQQDEPDED